MTKFNLLELRWFWFYAEENKRWLKSQLFAGCPGTALAIPAGPFADISSLHPGTGYGMEPIASVRLNLPAF